MTCLAFSKGKVAPYLINCLVCFLALSSLASAEQKKDLGDWEVHYIALNTTFLSPEVAKSNGIVRSRYNALINISVLDRQTKQAQSVVLSGQARNLLGVLKTLSFKQVKEGKAIYYLAVLPFSDLEQYRFTVQINDGQKQQELKFQHKFYAD